MIPDDVQAGLRLLWFGNGSRGIHDVHDPRDWTPWPDGTDGQVAAGRRWLDAAADGLALHLARLWVLGPDRIDDVDPAYIADPTERAALRRSITAGHGEHARSGMRILDRMAREEL